MVQLGHRLKSAHLLLFWIALASLVLLASAAPGWAQRREVTPAIVLPVIDASGSRDPMIAAKATDALALALEATRAYRVIAAEDLQRELAMLDLAPPLSKLQQVRVGEALLADKVLAATLKRLTLNERTGEVRAALEIRALDVRLQAVLTGSDVAIVTKPIPGWAGEPVPVINEALREVAERAVTEMEKTRIRHGTIMLVDDLGAVTTDLGVNDGVRTGSRLWVMRDYWVPELSETVIRNIGVLQITNAQVRLSAAKSVEGMVPRIGDRVYVLWSPPEEVRQVERARDVTQGTRLLAALGLGLGIALVATGPQSDSPPGAAAFLFQQRPGVTPVVRVDIGRGSQFDARRTHAWLFYRGPSAGFPAEADVRNYLVGAISTPAPQYWEDWPERQVGLAFTRDFQFIGRTGDQEDGSIDITYNRPELVPGTLYYYKIRAVVDPWRPQLPVAQQEPFADVSFSVDPSDALTQASAPAGPVTYSVPAVLRRPLSSGLPVDPSAARFEWEPSIGADQYQVQVYADPLLTQLVTASPVLTWTGQTLMAYTFTDFRFQGNRTYYWVVGSRTLGDPLPRCEVAGRTLPWILSDKESFVTVDMPPPAPSEAGSQRPDEIRGWWGERRLAPW